MSEINVTEKRYESILLAALAIITLAVFSPVIWHDFINYDDPAFVYSNPFIQSGLTVEAIRWAFTSSHEANWIPLTWITHMLDVQMFGMSPAGHHFVNVIYHAASTCLLFIFLKRSTGAAWQSLAVAVLFALHPLRVESVAWVAERKDVLSTFFFMLTLNAYLQYSKNPRVSSYLATIACFALGLLSKPMLVTLPIILLLLDWWPFGHLSSVPGSIACRNASLQRLIAEKIPFFLLAACSSLVTYLVQHASGEVTQGYTFLSRLGKVFLAYTGYLRKMFWPVDLAVLYPFSKYPPSTASVLLSACIILSITFAVIWKSNQYPFMLTGWGWYLVTLLPVIGLIQIGQHSVADRYTYIPLVGIFVMLAWGIPLLLGKWALRGVVLGVVSFGITAVMITLTLKQLQYWKNSETLFTHTINVTRDNWVAQNNLALVYLEEGRIDEAIYHLNESIKAKPSYALAYMNLGVAYRKKREFQLSRAAFEWVLQFEPGNPTAHVNLGLLYLDFGKDDLALQEYQALAAIDSPYAEDLLRAYNAVRSGKIPTR